MSEVQARSGPYAPEEDATVLELVAAGKSNAQVGAAIGRSAKSVGSRLSVIRPLNFHRPVSRHQYTADEDLSILIRREGGEGFIEIAKALDLSPDQVRDRHARLTSGPPAEAKAYEAFAPMHDEHVARCIEGGGFIYREVIDGAVLTFNWRGAVIHEAVLPGRAA